MANRVTQQIEMVETRIAVGLANGTLNAAKLEAERQRLDMDSEEYVLFQEMKSLAVSDGRLNIQEGMAIYRWLGNLPETFNKQSLAVKAVLTKIYSELLQARINARR